jgi:hypothetical protein
MKDALYDAEKAKARAKDEAFNPLVQNGKKLIPSVTRVFTTGHKISVFFQAYKEKNNEEGNIAASDSKATSTSAAALSPLYAFATLYQNGKSVYESKPKAITKPSANSFRKLPFSFEIENDQLPRGRYDLQITVLDPVKLKSSIWRTQVMLAP